jgi:predicted alpha/beta-hydrolase family hydrolase
VFPGAGSSAEHPALVAIADRLAPLPVHRVEFAYRAAGRKIPDRAPILIAEVRAAIAAACAEWRCNTNEIVIGGRSMGGRMCSLAATGFSGDSRVTQPAEAPLDVAGVVCVGYPLHPPRKPAQLRVAHLPFLDTPSLFISGTNDEFGTPDELREHLGTVRGSTTLHFIDKARHDLRGHDAVVADLIAAWVTSLNN